MTALVGCSSGSSSNTQSSKTVLIHPDIQNLEVNVTDPEIKLVLSETEKAYQEYWLNNNNKSPGIQLLKRHDWLFDSVVKNNGTINICVEFDFKQNKVISDTMMNNIKISIEGGINEWKKGLHGYKNWAFEDDVKVSISEVVKSKATQLEGEYADKLLHSDSCEQILYANYDFKVKFSDYNIGSRGYAGNWGLQLRWYVFLQELESQEFFITYHELGHVMGLPDVYTYPNTVESKYYLSDVKSIMANNGDRIIQDLDWAMLRSYYDTRN